MVRLWDKAAGISRQAGSELRRGDNAVRRAARRARDAIRGPTSTTARYWARRHERSAGMFDAQWETRDAPLRHLIAERIAALEPASVLEVGCGVGMNLHHIDASEVAGIDISEAAIEYARGKLPGCDLRPGPADELPYEADSFDVVFTCGLLVCIGPDRATEVLRELLRTSRGVVLLAEGGPPEGREDWNNGETTYWRRDYGRALSELNVSAATEAIPGDAAIGHIDTLITAHA